MVQRTVQQAGQDFSIRARIAVRFACAQLGKPYVWGGDGRAEGGFDCSGLTHAAFAAAGVNLPRTAQTQYQAGPLLPAGSVLEPGDLVFFGTPANVYHVAISLGGTKIVHAPTFGKPVQVADYRSFNDVLGASRPAVSRGAQPLPAGSAVRLCQRSGHARRRAGGRPPADQPRADRAHLRGAGPGAIRSDRGRVRRPGPSPLRGQRVRGHRLRLPIPLAARHCGLGDPRAGRCRPPPHPTRPAVTHRAADQPVQSGPADPALRPRRRHSRPP
ncbi:MAG: C40 family peptidase [Pseudonocardia sp.]|nr:C40 family peptidase [Pseudonocardia sp.]